MNAIPGFSPLPARREIHLAPLETALTDHFPGNPIVPGYLQLSWLTELVSPATVASFDLVRYRSPILPRGVATIAVDAEGRFTITVGDTLCTTGKLTLSM